MSAWGIGEEVQPEPGQWLQSTPGDVQGPPRPEPTDWNLYGSAAASFRQGNLIGSWLSSADSALNEPQPGYDVWNTIKGTKYENNLDAFANVVNPRYAQAIMSQIDMEEQDRRTLAATPWYASVPLGLAAGITDPTILAPVGGLIKAEKFGYSVAASAMLAAGAIGGATALQEAGLRSTQALRTQDESAVNIGTSIVLGGLLGGVGASLANRGELNAAVRALYESEGRVPVDATPFEMGRAAAAGAEATARAVTREDVLPSGWVAEKVARATSFMNPNLRSLFRLVPEVGQAAEQLSASGIYTRINEAGESLAPGGDVWSKIQTQVKADVATIHNTMYGAMRDLVKNGEAMRYGDFDAAVGQAMRNEDAHPNPIVQRTAQQLRPIFDRYAQEAVAAGMLTPEQIRGNLKAAASYFSRVENKEMVTRFPEEYKTVVAQHAKAMLEQGLQESTQSLRNKTEKLDFELALLKATPEERTARLAQLDELRQNLFDQNPEQAAAVDRIAELVRQQREYRDAGELDKAETVRKALEVLRAKTDTKQFRTYLSDLKKEEALLGKSEGGIQAKADQIQDALVDHYEAQRRQFERAIRAGQKLSLDLNKVGPEQLKEKIGGLFEAYHGASESSYNAVKRAQKQRDAIDAQIQQAREAFTAQKAEPSPPKLVAEASQKAPEGFTVTKRSDGVFLLSPNDVKTDNELNTVGLFYKVGPEGITTLGSYLPESSRGKGLGSKMYQHLLDVAEKHNVPLQSDDQISVEAQKLYEGLRKKGYTVEKNPTAETDDDGKTLYADGPVYTVSKPQARKSPTGTNLGDIAKLQQQALELEQKLGPLRQKLQEFEAAEQARGERVDAIWQKIEQASSINTDELQQAVREGADALTHELTDKALARGVRVARLEEKLKGLTPEVTQAEIAAREARKAKLEAAYREKWGKYELEGGFDDVAREVAQRRFERVTQHEYGNFEGNNFKAPWNVPMDVGPMRDKELWIPDNALAAPVGNTGRGFLEDSAERILTRYVRLMQGSLAMTRQFGDMGMQQRLADIGQKYQDLVTQVSQAKSMEELRSLVPPTMLDRFKGVFRKDSLDEAKQEAQRRIVADSKAAMDDLRAMRDLNLGTYKLDSKTSPHGRFLRATNMYNYTRIGGGFLLPNLSEIYRPAMVHGLGAFMQGTGDLLQGLQGTKLSVAEARKAGLTLETIVPHRMMDFAEIMDPLAMGGDSPIERLLYNMSNWTATLSGMRHFADVEQMLGGVLTQDKIGKALQEGTEDAYLGYVGLNKTLRGRIAKQLAEHGEWIDGHLHANTQAWSGRFADEDVRAYRAAVYKDVFSQFPTKSPGAIPLWAETPIGSAIAQFRTFNMAAHQKVMLRGMQEGNAKFTSGLIAMTTLGMLSAYLKAVYGGKDRLEKFKASAQNPGFWIGEGLDNSGLFPLFMDWANLAGGASRAATGRDFNPLKSPLVAAFPQASRAGDTTRYGQGSLLSQIGGPTLGLVDAIPQALGGIASGQPTKHNLKQSIQIMPMGSVPGGRQILQMLTGDSPFVGN